MKIVIACLFAAAVLLALRSGRRGWKKRRRATRAAGDAEHEMLKVIVGLRKEEGVTAGEPLEVQGLSGRERIRCIRAGAVVVSVYETRKARRYGFILYDEKKGDRHESREYPAGSPEALILVSCLEWRMPPAVPPTPEDAATPETAEAAS